VPADLGTADGIERWHTATIERFGGVDLLFANTGGPPAGGALGFDDQAWYAAFDLLLMSVVRTVRLVVPSMRARGGGAILVGTSSSVKEPVAILALSNVLRAGYRLSYATVPDLKKRKLELSVARPGTKVLLPASPASPSPRS